MKWIRIAAAVLNQTPLAWDQNSKNIRTAIQMARQAGAHVLCLPELCVTGYGCEDAFLSPAVQHEALCVVQELLPETRGMVVSFGLPLEFRGGLYNAAGLAADGKILGFVAKQNLAGEGLHYEPRWFKPWPNGVAVNWIRDELTAPLGDLVFDCGGVRIGFEICEDAWVANRPGVDLARRGVDVLLNPSASHFAFGKHQVRRRFVLDGSRAFHVAYAYANLLGNEAGRAIFDGDSMIASCGQMLVTGRRFSYADVELIHEAVDIDLIRTQKIRTHSHRADPTAASVGVISAEFSFPEISPPATPTHSQSAEDATSKYEEFTQAV
ncbi:MAG: NAD+ synthetase, partial [Planctomycetota bacterium]|nr:NAD+ synthetase [Planctomycetota bacterium]